jgi:integrase
MPTVELNGRTAPSLSCPAGLTESVYWSDQLPGFGLRCRASGARSWFVQYRTRAGKIRKHTLGTPQTVRFAKAYREAGRLIATARTGGDPVGDARKAKAAISCRELVDGYLAHQKPRLKARSYEELERHLKTHAKPLHTRRAAHLEQRDAVELLQKIGASAPVMANRVRASLSAMFVWGMKAGLVPTNPVAATFKPAEEKPRERVLADAELALIWPCSAGGTDYDRIVKLLILTGARREEIAGIAQSEVSRHADGGATWVLPSTRSKNHLPHELDLPPMTAALLPEPQEGADGTPRELLFGKGGGPFSGWSRCKQRLDERIAKANGGRRLSPWVLHDLRRTYVTRLNDLGVEPHVIEALVNHASGRAKAGVAGVYNRSVYAAQKRAALALWCDHIAMLVGQVPAEHNAAGRNVVPLQRLD